MIDNELLEQVISVSLKDKFLDKELIKKIIENIVEKTDVDTKNRYSGITFGDTKWHGDVVCTCDPVSGNIIVNYDKFIGSYIKSNLSVLDCNLDMISDFFHEIEHLKEQSKIKKLTFESLLLSYSSFDIFSNLAVNKLEFIKPFLNDDIYNNLLEKVEEKLYLKIYDKIPSERLATINSYKLLLESISSYYKFKENYPDTFIYINNTCVNKYYMGYQKIDKDNYFNIPLVDYLNFIKHPDLLIDFDFYSENTKKFLKKSSKKFSVEERMLYGLPVTLKETEKLDKKLILTK